MSETRTSIAAVVHDTPGIHFNGIVRALDLATGQVQYHVKRLLAQDDIVSTELYGRTHYFPTDFEEWDRRALALLRRETTGDIVAVLFERDRARPSEVASELDVARSTVEWHLERLIEQDLVAKRRPDGNKVVLELTRPEETIELVRDVDPSLLESLVAGYTQLLDDALQETGHSS